MKDKLVPYVNDNGDIEIYKIDSKGTPTKHRTKGRYVLDVIDGVIYSTDNYSIHILYDAMFFEGQTEVHRSRKDKHGCSTKATKEAWLIGLKQERRKIK